ncbi:MAG: hypothetical protein EOO50_04985 [Flavobacterium sp.]|uniref:hypothetical protein n=1 Tax=Flavobacterium sp. TaxID=239 RepID=UPI0012074F9D|nr:hypothetical protein [Flavobacterium sp.]RZJ67638.1 MAG: hypothetical protein EOO50_04985 [Flavobacterium sp.]
MNAYYKTNVTTTRQAEILTRLIHKRIYYAGELSFDLMHQHKLLSAVGIKKTETGIISQCMTDLGFSCEQL